MARSFAVAAAAFERALEGFEIERVADQEELGKRGALLAVADQVWQRHLGPSLNGEQARSLLGVRTRQALHDLVKRRRLLALPGEQGRAVYPAFQFDSTGRPHPSVPTILAMFDDAGVTAHTTASWFRSPQAALKGKTPADWIEADADADRLIEAARRSAARLGRRA